MPLNGNPTHLRQTHANPVNLTQYFNTNNYLPATNPNVSVSAANRTFGGNSSSSFSSQVSGVTGPSRGLASAAYLNKAYLQFKRPQRALAVLRQLQDTTYNNSRSTAANGYFHRTVAYGEQLNSNVAGPVAEPTPNGVQTTPLFNSNSVFAQKGANVGSHTGSSLP